LPWRLLFFGGKRKASGEMRGAVSRKIKNKVNCPVNSSRKLNPWLGKKP
jgi:hypothetical protein